MSIGERIYKLRKAKHYSQEELANKLNVSRQTVSKWETDQSTPDFDKIVPLCELFEISTDEFLKGETPLIKEENKPDKKRNALITSVSIFLYFLAIIWITLAEALYVKEEIIVAGFLFISAIATILLVYNSLLNDKEKIIEIEEKPKKEENKLKKIITNILGLIFCALYLIISFITMAWHLTWLIWLIYAAILEIINLIFMMGDVNEK